ncbi:MAG: hypothetical protein M1828_005151 [Chrysothrix sp. TS-e1954]|nr:MAG: hypothetical protein M1828_005151 [Chrysothrix sp. TS-e1954]
MATLSIWRPSLTLSRPHVSSLLHPTCPSCRRHAAHLANKMGKQLRNMPKKTRDTDIRQIKGDQKRRDAIAAIPDTLQPLSVSKSGLTLEQEAGVKEHYAVSRTPTRNLPVYQLIKGGGTLRLTRVRRVEGEAEMLRKQLAAFLQPKPEYVRINSVTGHVVIKGWYKKQVEQILTQKGF